MIDHHCYASNLSSCEIKVLKKWPELPDAEVSLKFSAGGQLVFTGRKNLFELNFFTNKKTFL